MLTETMLENAKKLNASVESSLNRIKSNIENSKQPNTEWNIYSPDIRQSKLTEQIDRVMARSVNELNRLEEDINIEIEKIRLKTLDTLQPLLRSKEIDKERSGQFWSDTAFKFVSMASISEMEAEYQRAVADKNIDYATGLIYWSVLQFKEYADKNSVKELKAEHSKSLGFDILAEAKRLLKLSLNDISVVSNSDATGMTGIGQEIIRKNRRQELLTVTEPLW